MSKLTDFLGGLEGGGGIGGMPIQIVSSDTLLSPNFSYGIDTSQGVVEVTLPASPIPGDRISFFDAALTWNKNPARIHVNGNQVEQETVALTSYLLNKKAGIQELLFISHLVGWKDISLYSTGVEPVWVGSTVEGAYPVKVASNDLTVNQLKSGNTSQDFTIPDEGFYVIAATGGVSSGSNSASAIETKTGGDTEVKINGTPALVVEGSPFLVTKSYFGIHKMASIPYVHQKTTYVSTPLPFFIFEKIGERQMHAFLNEGLGVGLRNFIVRSVGAVLSDGNYYGVSQESSSILRWLNEGDVISINVGAKGVAASNASAGKDGEFRIYKVEGLAHDL